MRDWVDFGISAYGRIIQHNPSFLKTPRGTTEGHPMKHLKPANKKAAEYANAADEGREEEVRLMQTMVAAPPLWTRAGRSMPSAVSLRCASRWRRIYTAVPIHAGGRRRSLTR